MRSKILCTISAILVVACVACADAAQWRFDCGKADSPLAEGYTRLTGDEQYSATRKHGWETRNAKSVDFGEHEHAQASTVTPYKVRAI